MNAEVQELVSVLREKQATLTLAESCTGGLLASQITAQPGVSDVYLGSFVTYSNRMKREILGVPSHILSTLGAVSRPVALDMARGAKALTQATWAVSITGIAGPSGGTDKKPVGTVCFAVVGPGVEKTFQSHFEGERSDVQQASVKFAAEILIQTLQNL